MNFISTFEELNKLYEEAQKKEEVVKEPVEEACSKENDNEVKEGIIGDTISGGIRGAAKGFLGINEEKAAADVVEEGIIGDTISGGIRGAAKGFLGINEDIDEEDAEEEDVIEIEDEDESTDEVTDEPRQVIIECDKCGAIVIRDEADIVADEESDLANVEDECEFCEEAAGYRIIGVVAPYNPEDVEVITEDLADWYRKKFDKPASIRTQQSWEDELNGEMGEISDKRRKHLERKFAQQRDWEARHADREENLGEKLGGAIAGGVVGGAVAGVGGAVAGAAIGNHIQNKRQAKQQEQ